MADAPTRNEVVIAVGGAAAALGGLVLVFLGVVVSGFAAYNGDTSDTVLNPYRCAAAAILSVFALSLVSTALAVTWLATGGGAGPLYDSALWTFFALLPTVLIVAVVTIKRVVLA